MFMKAYEMSVKTKKMIFSHPPLFLLALLALAQPNDLELFHLHCLKENQMIGIWLLAVKHLQATLQARSCHYVGNSWPHLIK